MFLMEVADHPLGATWVMPVFPLAAVFLPSVRRKPPPELRFRQYRSNPLGAGTLSGLAEYAYLSRTGLR